MIQEGKIGVQEAICLTTITISTKVFFTSPSFIARFVGTAGWYMTLISAATAALGFSFVYILLKRFPGKNLVAIFDEALGRFPGFVFSFLLCAFLLFLGAIQMREFIEVIKVFALPHTPPSFLIGIFLLVILTLSYFGLETIARFSRLIAIILLVSLVSVLLISSQNYEPRFLTPLLGYGLDRTVLHGIRRNSAYGEVVILAIFAASLQGSKHIRKAGFISLLLSGLIISSSILAFSLTFPYYSVQEITAPIYQMVRMIMYGSFIQRLDPIYLFLWNISTLIAITCLFYASTVTYCRMFRISDYKPVILPFGVTMFALTLLPKDFTSVFSGYVQLTRDFGWIFFFLLPLIALVTAIIRKKGGNRSNA